MKQQSVEALARQLTDAQGPLEDQTPITLTNEWKPTALSDQVITERLMATGLLSHKDNIKIRDGKQGRKVVVIEFSAELRA